VLIVGAGGLGCPVAWALAAEGVGTLGIADDDRVDLSNLHRQVLHRTARVGRPKVESVVEQLRGPYAGTRVYAYPTRMGPETLARVVPDYDVVVDATDAPANKYMLNDAAVRARTPLIHAGAVGFAGQAMTILPGETACLRCVFPEGDDDNAPTCSQDGVLGPVPGVVGSIQAAEALSVLRTGTSPLAGALVSVDLLGRGLHRTAVRPDPACPACSAQALEHATAAPARTNEPRAVAYAQRG